MKLAVLPPNVNLSDVEFSVITEDEAAILARWKSASGKTPSKKKAKAADAMQLAPAEIKGRIAFGLGAIRGVGAACMAAIVVERDRERPVQEHLRPHRTASIPSILTKGTLEILIKAGPSTASPRRELGPSTSKPSIARFSRPRRSSATRPAGRSRCSAATTTAAAERSSAAAVDAIAPAAEDWTHSQKLAFEKEVLGFYMTSHPLTEFADQLGQYTSQKVIELRDLGDGKDVLIGGMIGVDQAGDDEEAQPQRPQPVRQLRSRRPQRHRPLHLWPEDYARLGEIIKPEAVVLVKGRIDARGREPNIIANKIYTMAEAEKEFTKQVIVKFRRGYHTEQDMKRTRDVLARYPGKTPVMLFLDTWDEPKSNGTGMGKQRKWTRSRGLAAEPDCRSAAS